MKRTWLSSLLIFCAASLGCREQPPRAFPITNHESRSAETPESSRGNAQQPTEGAERDSLAPRTGINQGRPRKRRRAIIGTAAWCEPCHIFRSRNGSGNTALELVYVDIEQPCPATVTREEWDRLVATTRGMYGPNVEQAIPLALWQADNGKWYCKTVGGWSSDLLATWVRQRPGPRI